MVSFWFFNVPSANILKLSLKFDLFVPILDSENLSPLRALLPFLGLSWCNRPIWPFYTFPFPSPNCKSGFSIPQSITLPLLSHHQNCWKRKAPTWQELCSPHSKDNLVRSPMTRVLPRKEAWKWCSVTAVSTRAEQAVARDCSSSKERSTISRCSTTSPAAIHHPRPGKETARWSSGWQVEGTGSQLLIIAATDRRMWSQIGRVGWSLSDYITLTTWHRSNLHSCHSNHPGNHFFLISGIFYTICSIIYHFNGSLYRQLNRQ